MWSGQVESLMASEQEWQREPPGGGCQRMQLQAEMRSWQDLKREHLRAFPADVTWERRGCMGARDFGKEESTGFGGGNPWQSLWLRTLDFHCREHEFNPLLGN